MVCNRKRVSLDIYAKAAKYYSNKRNQTQDDNKEITSLEDKFRDALNKSSHNQPGLEVEEGNQKREQKQG